MDAVYLSSAFPMCYILFLLFYPLFFLSFSVHPLLFFIEHIFLFHPALSNKNAFAFPQNKEYGGGGGNTGGGKRLEKMKCLSKVLIRERGNLKSLWRCLEIYQ